MLELAGLEAGAPGTDDEQGDRNPARFVVHKEEEVIPGYTAPEIEEIFSHGPSRVIAVDILPMAPIR